jgi:CcmD family protein
MTKPIVILSLLMIAATAAYADQPAPEPAYVSPDRDHCVEELRKDKAWHEDLELQLYDNVHKAESETFTRNNRHVILAYAAIWVLTAGFVVLVWLRQGKLKAEIARLTADVTAASKDEA